MPDTPKANDPVLVRFGQELARVRGLSDYSQEGLGKALKVSGSLIGYLERGERKPKKKLIESIDELLELDGHLMEYWWAAVKMKYPEYAGTFMEAMPRASLMRDYHPLVVPGLFQSEEYARSFFRASNPMETEDAVEELVEQRMARHEMLTDSDRPVIWVVITETVLRCLEGNPDVLRSQVDRLLELIASARVRLQVIPATVRFSDHPGMDGAFTLLTLPDEAREVVYIEGATAGSMITDHKAVDRLSLKFGSLQGAALTVEQTAEFLKKIRSETDG